jgi:hypothetical protein
MKGRFLWTFWSRDWKGREHLHRSHRRETVEAMAEAFEATGCRALVTRSFVLA